MNKAHELELLLSELLAHHHRMLELAREHRAALATADHRAVTRLVQAQQIEARKMVDMESRRVRLVNGWPGAATIQPGHTITLSRLAQTTAEPIRSRLLTLADRLRSVLATLQEAQAAIAMASQSLMLHMRGIMAQVSRQLSHAGTYARSSNAQPATAPVVSGIDIRS